MTRISAELIARKYADDEWRHRFLKIVDVVTLLRHCLIEARYRIPDAMNDAIQLSDYGTKIQRTLTAKHEVPAKEARMMCFLGIAEDEPFMDVMRTDIEGLVGEISNQIKSGAIRYPMALDRGLYDKAADMFPTMRSRLNAKETIRLLEGTPCGVFQVGTFITGPLGILEGTQERWFPPTSSIPLQHCPEISCGIVHDTFLSTSFEAPINQHLPKMDKVLQSREETSAAWTEFTNEIGPKFGRSYDDLDAATASVTLGDCFPLQDLQRLAFWLHEASENPRLRDLYRIAGFGSDTENHLRRLKTAELIQLCWLASDHEILAAIDALIRSKQIQIEDQEIRAARLNRASTGAFHVGLEFGSLGARFTSSRRDLPLLRLHRLVSHLYDLSSPTDTEEIEWQLRGIDKPELVSRLEEFLRSTEPAMAVRALVLARRRNVNKAIKELRLAPEDFKDPADPLGMRDFTDEQIIQKILWRLGFDRTELFKITTDFWRHHGDMMTVVRQASTGQGATIERVKEKGNLFFQELEHVLEDNLMYTFWALTTDHPSASNPFVYYESMGDTAWPTLDAWRRQQPGAENLSFLQRRTLYPLARLFKLLADYLADLKANQENYKRESAQKPRWADQTELRKFPFASRHLFLDLLPVAQDSIIAGLRSITEMLIRADVPQVRNELSHFQRTPLELERLENALDACRRAVEKSESLGFCRISYTMDRREVDRWGRSSYVLVGADGTEFNLGRPTAFQWLQMPHLSGMQYVFKSAAFAPGEVLRFDQGFESPYSKLWENYPKRRRSGKDTFYDEHSSPTDVARDSHRVLPAQH